MRQWVFRIVVAAVGLVVLALIVRVYLPKPVTVDLARVTRRPLTVTVEEDGKTRVRHRYVLSAPVAGVAQRIELKPGDPVEAGAVVARVESSPAPLLDPQAYASAQARLRSAEAARAQSEVSVHHAEETARLARVELARMELLHRGNAIPQDTLDQSHTNSELRDAELANARFGERIAAHDVEIARAALGLFDRSSPSVDPSLDLTSPIRGQVLRVMHESEGAVTPGAQLLELGDLDDLEVVVDVATRDAVVIRPGMEVLLERWGGDQPPLHGRVHTVEPSGFTKVSPLGVEEQRVNVRVEVVDPPAKRATLGDAFAVDARFIVWQGPQVLQVPSSAVFRYQEGWAVFAVRDGRARLQRVELGHRAPLSAEVVSGVAEGDSVVVHPGDTVVDGVRVRAR